MEVYVILYTVQYDYDNGREHRGLYGVAATRERADELVRECEAQVGGYFEAHALLTVVEE